MEFNFLSISLRVKLDRLCIATSFVGIGRRFSPYPFWGNIHQKVFICLFLFIRGFYIKEVAPKHIFKKLQEKNAILPGEVQISFLQGLLLKSGEVFRCLMV